LISCDRFAIVNGQPVVIHSCSAVTDRCGGFIDCECPNGHTCNESTLECEPPPPGPTPTPCVPSCTGCGTSDGCGGVCKVCDAGKTCVLSSQKKCVLVNGRPFCSSASECRPSCSTVECGTCSDGGGDIIISQIKQCPTGQTCNSGKCEPAVPDCPEGCTQFETCNTLTDRCECGSSLCDRSTQYCSAKHNCCLFGGLLDISCE
jgi:hypothetical protein